MNDQNNQIQTETLSDKVKAARSQARDILRMRMINTRLAKIYDVKQEITDYKKEIEAETKNLAIFIYEKNKKLDTEHPDYENILKLTEETIKSRTEMSEETLKDINEVIKNLEEKAETLEKEINEIEVGDKKVNIEEVNELAREIINKI